MNSVMEKTSNKDAITTVLKVLSTVYLVLNIVRLGMDLHEKIIKKQED